MNDAVYSRLADTISKHESVIVRDWLENQRAEGTLSKGLEAEVQQQSREFLTLLKNSLRQGRSDIMAAEWTDLRELLTNLSDQSHAAGILPVADCHVHLLAQTALFERLKEEFGRDADSLAHEVWTATLPARQAWTMDDGGLSENSRSSSFHASSRRCWSFQLRW